MVQGRLSLLMVRWAHGYPEEGLVMMGPIEGFMEEVAIELSHRVWKGSGSRGEHSRCLGRGLIDAS